MLPRLAQAGLVISAQVKTSLTVLPGGTELPVWYGEMNPQDKIGVLTFHRCINYGSYWQARCLVEGLRARGRETVLLEHHSSRVNLAEWRCALQPVLPTPVPKSDHSLYADKIRKFFNAFAALPCSPR